MKKVLSARQSLVLDLQVTFELAFERIQKRLAFLLGRGRGELIQLVETLLNSLSLCLQLCVISAEFRGLDFCLLLLFILSIFLVFLSLLDLLGFVGSLLDALAVAHLLTCKQRAQILLLLLFHLGENLVQAFFHLGFLLVRDHDVALDSIDEFGDLGVVFLVVLVASR